MDSDGGHLRRLTDNKLNEAHGHPAFAYARYPRSAMASSDLLERTPYFFCGRQPFREERLLSYIHGEHRRGRHFSEILDDPYVHRCGSHEFVWTTLRHTSLIELLQTDIREAFERASDAVLEGH